LRPDRSKGSISNIGEQAGALASTVIGAIKTTIKPERSHLAEYIGLLDESERRLVKSFTQLRESHSDEPDINAICKLFAEWSQEAQPTLKPFIEKYGERHEGEPERLDRALLVKRSHSAFDVLRDLHDLWLLVNESMMSLNILEQGARGIRDEELLAALKHMQDRNERQRDWLQTRINRAAP
jgi:hypothetical protein